MYYELNAEHISRSTATKLLDATDITVINARMSDTFSNCALIVVSNEKDAKAMRDLLWAANGGACVEMYTVSADDLEEFL
jgi:hypothetical protein